MHGTIRHQPTQIPDGTSAVVVIRFRTTVGIRHGVELIGSQNQLEWSVKPSLTSSVWIVLMVCWSRASSLMMLHPARVYTLTSVHPLLIHWTSIYLHCISLHYVSKIWITKTWTCFEMKFFCHEMETRCGKPICLQNHKVTSWQKNPLPIYERKIYISECVFQKVQSSLQTSTSNFSMPGSLEEWPASGTMWSVISGKTCHISSNQQPLEQYLTSNWPSSKRKP